ncbi:hypothetical protein AMS68_004901 [Peltaster fructicola]|uniref:GPN-loop GTPase 2 n=1 Tax=Peltaster fructicola TaxID=286661 RepID=A0A6H0XXD0_9PEZI|nr:hypothetical protein AMS68_004901 [Peltaster fructicola]
MEREELGPNGGVLWAMEELEANFDWLVMQLKHCEDTVILDPPGQPELTSHHTALPKILTKIEKLGYRIVVVQLLDSVVLTRPSLYLSSLLLCVRGMLHLPYPIVGGRDLPFNLDFYTEVQDLDQLLPALSAEMSLPEASQERWDRLNEALINLVSDFGLVGFETLAVEDRASMAALLRAIDRASGQVFANTLATDEQGRTLNDEASIWAQAMSDHWAGRLDVQDIQERWIDRKEEFDEIERKAWEDEAKEATAMASERNTATVVRKDASPDDQDMVDDDDELLQEQRRWKQQQKGTAAHVHKPDTKRS